MQRGQPNTIAVCVKNEGKNSRWYSGSGIYRHTWLTVVNPVHIGVWGVRVETPSVNENSAEVNISTNLINSGKEGKTGDGKGGNTRSFRKSCG